MFILFFKLLIVVILTVFLASLQGKMELSFIGYEIHMHSTIFALLILFFTIFIWKITRIIDWIFYVPRNFLDKRKLEKKVNLIDDIIVASLTKDVDLLQNSNKNIKSILGQKNYIYQIINSNLKHKDKRVNVLLTLIDDCKVNLSLKQFILLEILKYNNDKINNELFEKLNSNNDLSALTDIYNSHKQQSFDKAKAFLNLAKMKGITNNSYLFNLCLLKIKYNQDDVPKSIINIWNKIKNDNYLNMYMPELLESLKQIDKITATQFKLIEKLITKKSWQGCLLISVLALKVPLYGVANDYLNNAINLVNDSNNNLVSMVKTELMLSKWDKITDQEKYELLQNTIKYNNV